MCGRNTGAGEGGGMCVAVNSRMVGGDVCGRNTGTGEGGGRCVWEETGAGEGGGCVWEETGAGEGGGDVCSCEQ